MRRRRSRLQVTTFPFLAVLLCTLGVLIMLLLILDQRSRLQARLKAEHESAEARRALEQRLQDEAALRANQRRERVAALTAQRDETRSAAQAVQQRHTDTVARMAALQKELASIERSLQAEQERRADHEQAAEAQQAERQRLAGERTAAETELTRLHNHIAALEQAIVRLQEASRLRQPLYTLQPYRGKQGTRRQPVYLECVGDQLVFQPDGHNLPVGRLGATPALQAQLEDRLGKSVAGNPGNRPYVLLLIRPSGIPLYYILVRALRNSDIDLGYEFIEEDWALDFSAAGETARSAPPPALERQATGPGPTPVRAASAGQPGPGGPGKALGIGVARLGAPIGAERQPQRPVGAGEPLPRPLGGEGPGVRGVSGDLPGRPGTPPTGTSGRAPGPPGDAIAHGSSGPAATESPGRGSPIRPPSGTAGVDAPAPTQPVQPAGEKRGTQGKPSSTGGGPQTGEHPADSAAAGPTPVKSGLPGLPTGTEERPRNDRPTPLGPAAPGEWQIIVECSAAHVVLHTMEKLTLDSAHWNQDGPLLRRTVGDMVERKLAKFPDIRPQLKFQIRPEGLRTYYQAADALDALNLPVTWEFLPAEPNRTTPRP